MWAWGDGAEVSLTLEDLEVEREKNGDCAKALLQQLFPMDTPLVAPSNCLLSCRAQQAVFGLFALEAIALEQASFEPQQFAPQQHPLFRQPDPVQTRFSSPLGQRQVK
jgi:hypothetical protein